MKVRDILEGLQPLDLESEVDISVDVRSVAPEECRRVFCDELLGIIVDPSGLVTICVTGEWNIPER